MSENDSLSVRQNLFIDALLAHSTIKQASESCHISERTGHRWMKDPYVQSRYREALKALHQQNMAKLIKSEDAAINTLLRNLTAKSPFVQVQAAGKLLDLVAEVYKVNEIESILSELKERLPVHGQLRRIT